MKLPYIFPRVLLDPEETDANQGAGSSTASAATENEGESATPSDDKDKEPTTLAEVVKAATKGSETEESSTSEQTEEQVEEESEGENEERPEGETETEEEEDDEEENSDRLDKNPRFQEVLKEKNTLKAENEKLKPQAEQAQALTKFCVDNGITHKDLIGALELTALSRKNPEEFIKRVSGIVDEYNIAKGAKLPDDLAKEVEEGTLSEVRAKELAKARLQNGRSEEALREERQNAETTRQMEIQNGLNAWTDQQLRTDTGFEKRYGELVEAVHFDWQRNPPKNLQDAIVLVEKANKRVKERSASRLPKKPTNKVLNSRNGSSPNHGEDFTLDNLATDLPKLVNSIASRKR